MYVWRLMRKIQAILALFVSLPAQQMENVIYFSWKTQSDRIVCMWLPLTAVWRKETKISRLTSQMKLSLPRLRRVRSRVEKCVSTRLRKWMWREKKNRFNVNGRAGGRRGLRRVGIELSLKRIKEVIQDIFMLPRERAAATCDGFGTEIKKETS